MSGSCQTIPKSRLPGIAGGTFDTQFTFAQSLIEAATATSGVLLAISVPASETGKDPNEVVAGNAEEVGGRLGLEALQRLQNVFRRVAHRQLLLPMGRTSITLALSHASVTLPP